MKLRLTYWADILPIYEDRLDFLFNLFDINLVVYDEAEKFREYNHPKFNYPYEHRKNYVGLIDMNLTSTNVTSKDDDYSYEEN